MRVYLAQSMMLVIEQRTKHVSKLSIGTQKNTG